LATADAPIVFRHVGEHRGLLGVAQFEPPPPVDQPLFRSALGEAREFAAADRSSLLGVACFGRGRDDDAAFWRQLATAMNRTPDAGFVHDPSTTPRTAPLAGAAGGVEK